MARHDMSHLHFGALVQMNGGSVARPRDVSRFDEDFELPAGTFVEMHLLAEDMVTSHGYKPVNRLVSHLDGATAADFTIARAEMRPGPPF